MNGKSVILTVVKLLFSKSAHFIALGHPYTATSVARVFFADIIRLRGIPSSIVSDRDPVFTSNFWRELFKLSGVQLNMSSVFHPQTNGQSKSTNKIIAMYLCYLTGYRPRNWLQWLPWVEFCYNSSFQAVLGTTPFRVTSMGTTRDENGWKNSAPVSISIFLAETGSDSWKKQN